MNEQTSARIADAVLSGSFGVLDTTLGVSHSVEITATDDFDPGAANDLAQSHGVVFLGRVADSGGLALLLTTQSAAAVAAAISEGAPAAVELDDAHRSVLSELAEPVLSGGFGELSSLYGGNDEGLENVEAVADAESAVARLEALFANPATKVTFNFSLGDAISGVGVLLYDQNFDDRVESSEDAAAALAQEPQVSDAEMSEILSGFDTMESAPEARSSESAPQNLDMILDINLEVTARLGSVEMPIGEVLSLGPGSILEVGHLVDEPIELFVNNRLIARGDVVVVDEKFGLRITEIISPRKRIESLR